jgi:DNA-binding transcriptional ArsR family regulator
MPRPVHEVKAELFKTLGHPVRIRILETLREGAASVADIAAAVDVRGSTLSQHLATLRQADVVMSHRSGSQVIYQVVDPRVFQLLEIGKQMLTSSLTDSTALLADLEETSLEIGR